MRNMSILHIVRLVLFGLLLLFSLLVLGMSANLLNISSQNNGSLPFEGLAVAVSVITFFTVIPIIVIDFIRRGAFSSLVIFEIGWVFVLMILWIAAAAETSATPIFIGGCSDFDDDAASNCHQFQAIQAFAWLNFIILFGWLVTLIVGCAIQHTKGNSGVWKSPVSETAFFGAGSSAPGGAATGPTSSAGYPPQHQYPGQPPVQMQQQQQGYPSPQPGVQGSPQQQSTPQPASQESPSPHHHHHDHQHQQTSPIV